MISGNRDYRVGEDLADLTEGLEQLARHLDAQRYPGHGWPVSTNRLSRHRPRKVVPSLVAAAAAVVVGGLLVFSSRAPQPAGGPVPGSREPVRSQPRLPEDRLPGGGEVVRQGPRNVEGRVSGEPALPRVLVVEDLESYSFIDLTTGAPIISFASKDPCAATCAVAVLPEPTLQRAETENGI